MAKESGREELNNYPNYLDRTINYLYRIGMLHSIIWHTSILLILCLSVSANLPLQKISLELSFSNSFSSVVEEEIIEIDFDKEEVSASGNNESEILEEIVESNNNIEPILTEEIKSELFIEELTPDLIVIDDLTDELVTETATTERQNTPQNVLGDLVKNIPTSGSNGLNNGFGETGQALEIGRRLNAAGAKTGDVQVSIGWNTVDDIDVHVFFRSFGQNSYISWTNRQGVCGGMLDIDMNANDANLSNKPVENIFWPAGHSPYGEFVVSLHNFRNWSGSRSVPVTLIIKVDGETKVIQTQCVYGMAMTEVARFNRVRN
jgi:hypothetical protein